MANNFRWFDQPAQYSPGGIEDYVSGKNSNMGYQPSQQGFLSLLGAGISGGVAPFLGDYTWLERRNKQQMEQAQADNEFRAALLKLRQQGEESQQSKDFQNKYLEIIKAQAQAQAQNNPLLANEQQPSLADAFPVKEQKLLTKQGFSTSGKPFTSQTVDPEYQKSLELRNNQIKEFEDFANPLEKLASRLDILDKAIDNTPEFKPGIGSKLIAQGTNALADLNNEKWFREYDMALNKSFLPAAQAEDISKVMSDLDLTTQIKSLGDSTAPRSIKKEAIKQIIDSLATYSKSKMNAFGVNKDIVSKIYPEANRVFWKHGISSKKSNNKTGSISKDNLFEGL